MIARPSTAQANYSTTMGEKLKKTEEEHSPVEVEGAAQKKEEEDECNLINKEDFEEGKPRNIITSRGTPIKTNALERKNVSTTRQPSGGRFGLSPSMISSAVEYQDPNNPKNIYYQINPPILSNRLLS